MRTPSWRGKLTTDAGGCLKGIGHTRFEYIADAALRLPISADWRHEVTPATSLLSRGDKPVLTLKKQ